MLGSSQTPEGLVGVIAPLPQEAQILGVTATVGSILRLNQNTILSVPGVGAKAVRQSVMQLAGRGVRAVVSFGTAAAVDPALKPGTLLLPKRIHHLETGEIYAVHREWRDRLEQRVLTSVVVNDGLQVDTIVDSSQSKAQLFQQTGCVFVDMESATIGQCCSEAGLAFVVLRAVTDGADLTIPSCVLKSMTPHGDVYLSQLLLGLLKNPWQIPALIRLGFGFTKAKKVLKNAMSEFSDDLEFGT